MSHEVPTAALSRVFRFTLTVAGVAGLVEAVISRNVLRFALIATVLVGVATLAILRRLSLRSARIYTTRLRLAGLVAHMKILRKIVPKSWRMDDFFDQLAWFSLRHAQDRGYRQPLIVPSSVLRRRGFWPEWAFNAAIVLKGFRIERDAVGNQLTVQLDVDLNGRMYAVYNNVGKGFLRERFSNAQGEALKKLSLQVHKLCLPSADPLAADSGSVELDSVVPIRWASGGAFVIASWRGRKWATLFFRDIDPIGWNVANGASESETEQFDIQRLIFREFSEELVVLDRDPTCGLPIGQKSFILPWVTSERDPLRSRGFSERQRELRREQDGLVIQANETKAGGCKVWVYPTDFDIQVERADRKPSCLANVVFTINPLELGAEVLHVINIRLSDGDYVLDGEILEFGEVLARRPIVFLDMEFLKAEYASHRQIGEDMSMERRLLSEIPQGAAVLFGQDVTLRRKRLEQLRSEGGDRREIQHHEAWLARYETAFETSDFSDKDLRTLCPVTWKTLELMLAHNVL